MSTTITSPFPFTGETTVGVVSLDFTDGVATFDGTLSQEAASLLRSNGFAVNAPIIESEDTRDFDDPTIEPIDDDGDLDQTPTMPAKSASKAEWVDYGVSQGHDRGSLEELTRTEIQILFEDS